MDPEEAQRLGLERHRLRRAKNFAGADAIRDRLREAGWEIVDGPDSFALHPLERAPTSRLITVLTLVHGWPQDARRWLESVLKNTREHDFEAVVVGDGVDAGLGAEIDHARVRTITQQQEGWAAAANRGIQAATGRVVVLFDPGVELTGDVAGPLLAALKDDSVALAGAFGVRCEDGQVGHFHESPGPEVDALEGYCLAFRREQAVAAGGFDRRFKFYRIADFDFSFRLRERYGRAVVVPDLPLIKHEHRLWEALSPEKREQLSRRNFYRFMDSWRDRGDLLVER